jgi:hypothetical protein
MDNDFGEHWFDNWDLREERAAKAKAMGIAEEELLIIDPHRFQDGRDGPCHDAMQRKRFWTDVVRSLELSYETRATFSIVVGTTTGRRLDVMTSRRYPRIYGSHKARNRLL